MREHFNFNGPVSFDHGVKQRGKFRERALPINKITCLDRSSQLMTKG